MATVRCRFPRNIRECKLSLESRNALEVLAPIFGEILLDGSKGSRMGRHSIDLQNDTHQQSKRGVD